MNLILREYQRQGVDDTVSFLFKEKGHPLLVTPTGTGKSVIAAVLMNRIFDIMPSAKVLLLSHNRELVSHDYQAFRKFFPDIETGVYSAGLKRKELNRSATFASVQSLLNVVDRLQPVNIVIIDEAHMVPVKQETSYRTIIDKLLQKNPKMRVIGLTATPYRLNSGLLTAGENRLFTDISYEYSILDAIEDGYLTPIVPPRGTRFKLELPKLRAGAKSDNLKKQSDVANSDEKIKMAIEETIAEAGDRKSWLVFCSSIEHAENTARILNEYGIKSAAVHGKISGEEYQKRISKFKSGEYTALTNVELLTTGFDHPAIDLIVMLRATASAVLYVQIIGRALRLIYPQGANLPTAEERRNAIEFSIKPDAMVLDFVGNIMRHGPVDQVVPPPLPGQKKKGNQDAPVKECPKCRTIIPASTMTCSACDYIFPPAELEISRHASQEALLSTQIEAKWHDVVSTSYKEWRARDGEPQVEVIYECNQKFRENITFSTSTSWKLVKARQWWTRRRPDVPPPTSNQELLNNIKYLPEVESILIEPKRIKGKLKHMVRDIKLKEQKDESKEVQ